MAERIQKLLASHGLGSRREIERWIREGRLKVDGELAEIGQKITGKEIIHRDGRLLNLVSAAGPDDMQVLLYRKPEGEIVTRRDPEGRKSVFESLPRPKRGRWISVGRLDINTAGLILFTNDGDLANALMHPSKEVEREYSVRVLGDVDEAMLKRLTKGVMLEDGKASFDSIIRVPDSKGESGANHWYSVIVSEGRNRLIRRLWASQEREVSRLVRLRFGPIILPRGLKTGKSILLDEEQVAALREACGA